MRPLVGILVFMCLLAGISASSDAQPAITITAFDVGTQLAERNILTNNTDTLTTSVNIGTPGSTSWDFSGLLTHTSMVLTSVAVSSTPYAADFPTATHALQSNVVVSGVAGIAYQYVTLGTSLLNPGNKGGGQVSPPPFQIIATVTTTNTPVDSTYQLPSTFGTTWTSTYTATQVIALNGIPFGTTVTNHKISYVVDAYGQMTIPGGSTYDALRIQKVDTVGGTTVGYIFLAKNGASVQLTALNALQPNNGVIQVQPKSITWSGPTTILPIQLSYFNASLDANHPGVLLRWGTLSELNNFGFEVQKAATSNGDFQTIPNGFVQGHGTTNVPQDYACTDQNASSGIWYYRLKQLDLDGTSHPSEPIRLDVATDVNEGSMPAEFLLGQNYPNPFNPSTVIRYGLPYKTYVSLVVYNALGQRLATLVNQNQDAGYHEIRFDGKDLASGVYFYRLTAGDFAATRRFVLLK